MSNERNGTLYIGVTSNLLNRITQHRNKEIEGFTKKYNVARLLYYEYFNDINDAIVREKQLKNWRREWKIALIEKDNPHWSDLYQDLL